MNRIVLALIIGSIASAAPLLSLGIWSFLLYIVSSHVRYRVRSIKDHVGEGRELMFIFISLMIPVFVLSALISGGLAIVISLMVTMPPILVEMALGTGGKISMMIGLISAGPVEESTKLLVSCLLFFMIKLLHPKVLTGARKLGIKDGIITGLFVGAGFGAMESVLYLTGGLTTLLTEPLSYENLDPVVFRMLLGVSIHSVYTGISSAALGDGQKRIRMTVKLLIIASVLHSLNNGIQGAILVVAELDGMFWLVMIGVMQTLLFVASLILLHRLWKQEKIISPG